MEGLVAQINGGAVGGKVNKESDMGNIGNLVGGGVTGLIVQVVVGLILNKIRS